MFALLKVEKKSHIMTSLGVFKFKKQDYCFALGIGAIFRVCH